MTLPNFILGGAQKSASTTLFQCLDAHPQCLMSRPKEPSFFSRADRLDDLAKYEACFAHQEETGPDHPKIVGEASASYMAEPYVPQRIADCLGTGVKLAFIVRNPAQRAVSAYWHLYKRGSDRRSLKEVFHGLPEDPDHAVVVEQQRLDAALADGRLDLSMYRDRYDDPTFQFRYLANSRYPHLLDRYRAVFPPAGIHVVVLERLTAHPAIVFGELATFLGIDPAGFPDDFRRVFNPTIIPRRWAPWRQVHRFARSRRGKKLRRRLPAAEHAYQRLGFYDKPPTPPQLHDKLRTLFATDTRALSQTLGLDLSALKW